MPPYNIIHKAPLPLFTSFFIISKRNELMNLKNRVITMPPGGKKYHALANKEIGDSKRSVWLLALLNDDPKVLLTKNNQRIGC